MKKILFIVLVLAALYVLYLISGLDILRPKGELNLNVPNIHFEYDKLIFDEWSIKYKVNSVIKEMSSDKVEMVIFISDLITRKSRPLSEDNFTAVFCFINGEDTTNFVCNKVDLLDYHSQQTKNAIALALDYSGSMFIELENDNLLPYQYLEKAVYKFINYKRNDDLLEIIKFGENIDRVGNFEQDKSILWRNLWTDSYQRDGTALLSACQTGIEDVIRINNDYKKAIVAFTDGGDNSSTISESELIQNAILGTVPIFTIGFKSEKAETNFELLENVAESTGGFFYSTPSASELAYLYECIDNNLKLASTVRFTWDSQKFPREYNQVDLKVIVNEGNKVIGKKLIKNVQI